MVATQEPDKQAQTGGKQSSGQQKGDDYWTKQTKQIAGIIGSQGILSKGREELIKTIKGGAKKEQEANKLLFFTKPTKENQITERLEEREKDIINKRKHQKKR